MSEQNDAYIARRCGYVSASFMSGVVVHSRSPTDATLSVRLLWAFARLMGTPDWSTSKLLAAGISSSDFADPDARIGHEAAMGLLENAIVASKNPALGLHAAGIAEPGDFDVLEYAARGCPNLGQAFACMARYFRLMNEAAELEIATDDERAILSYRVTDGVRQPRAAVDFAIAALVHFARRNTEFDEKGMEVRFVHPEPTYLAEYERVFRCRIRFGSTENAVVMPRDRLDTPMRRADARITRAFELRADHLLDRLKQGDGTAGRVRDLAIKHLGSGQVTMGWTARRLAMSVPTLRRHLEAEGTTFSTVVVDVRKRIAASQLKAGASVTELAFALGFSSVSAFHRAFKRWTGVSPAEFRRSTEPETNGASDPHRKQA